MPLGQNERATILSYPVMPDAIVQYDPLTNRYARNAARGSIAAFWNLPGRRTAPVDATLGTASLTGKLYYYKNLTVTGTVTLPAGGIIIVVEDTLTIGASGILDANALGARGGEASTVNNAFGGYGGGQFGSPGRNSTNEWLSSNGGFVPNLASWFMASGGASPTAASTVGGTGSAWPYLGSSDLAHGPPTSYGIVGPIIDLIGSRDGDATRGYIGGGGGGGGGTGGGSMGGTSAPGGVLGGRGTGQNAANDGLGAGGGSGFGGGGSGGSGNATGSGAGAVGGRGGGVVLILCRVLNNAGIIRANGATGSNGATNSGGGGGGGGGLVAVVYEALTALGTLQANGGSGGTGAGGAGNGGPGGAGLAVGIPVSSG